jgi:Mce-associated membrane protein
MSTTRHPINRQRRLAAASAATVARPRTVRPAQPRTAEADDARAAEPAEPAASAASTAAPQSPESTESTASPEPAGSPEPAASAARTALRRPSRTAVLAGALALLTVLLGGFAAWAAHRASDLRDSSATGNTALTDTARTSEVKGAIAQDVDAVFSYDYADTARTDAAAARVLTGRAVRQYATMLAQVRAQAPAKKLVLTTTVTDTGVVTIDGDRARVLVYADQRNTSTASSAGAGGSTYAAAMFAVDAVRQGGSWKIASIDTFG